MLYGKTFIDLTFEQCYRFLMNMWLDSLQYEPRQANLCLRAFRHDKF